jgi:hypothetical protein
MMDVDGRLKQLRLPAPLDGWATVSRFYNEAQDEALSQAGKAKRWRMASYQPLA